MVIGERTATLGTVSWGAATSLTGLDTIHRAASKQAVARCKAKG